MESIPHYEPYGPEWEKEVSNLSKENLIMRLRTKAKEVDRLDDIAQTKCGENMKLTVERDELRKGIYGILSCDGGCEGCVSAQNCPIRSDAKTTLEDKP